MIKTLLNRIFKPESAFPTEEKDRLRLLADSYWEDLRKKYNISENGKFAFDTIYYIERSLSPYFCFDIFQPFSDEFLDEILKAGNYLNFLLEGAWREIGIPVSWLGYEAFKEELKKNEYAPFYFNKVQPYKPLDKLYISSIKAKGNYIVNTSFDLIHILLTAPNPMPVMHSNWVNLGCEAIPIVNYFQGTYYLNHPWGIGEWQRRMIIEEGKRLDLLHGWKIDSHIQFNLGVLSDEEYKLAELLIDPLNWPPIGYHGNSIGQMNIREASRNLKKNKDKLDFYDDILKKLLISPNKSFRYFSIILTKVFKFPESGKLFTQMEKDGKIIVDSSMNKLIHEIK